MILTPHSSWTAVEDQDQYSSEPEAPFGDLPIPRTPTRRSSSVPLVSSPLSLVGSPLVRKRGGQKGARRRKSVKEIMMTPLSLKKHRAEERSRRDAINQIIHADQLRLIEIQKKEKAELELAERQRRQRQQEQDEEAANLRQTLALIRQQGYSSLSHLLDRLFTCKDANISSLATRFTTTSGARLIAHMRKRDESIFWPVAQDIMFSKLIQELDHLMELLRPSELAPITQLLSNFDLQKLMLDVQEGAPNLWLLLEFLVLTEDNRTKLEGGQKLRRNRHLIISTICVMVVLSRNEKANNFQLTIGLFLLGSGVRRNVIEVLAHAGLSISYTTIMRKIQQVSMEGRQHVKQIARRQMCMLVWDNINIAHKVAQQRIDSKDHFDNGTTATLIPLFSPRHGSIVPHGTLPLNLKTRRVSDKRFSKLNPCVLFPTASQDSELRNATLYQLRKMALAHIPFLTPQQLEEYCGVPPVVYEIPLHQTEQYPLPAMKIDESSIEGTINVLTMLLTDVLGFSAEDLEKHGLFFVDGDLLTMSLVDKVECARRADTNILESMQFTERRFGLFQAKMAGARLVMNQHWGKPNSKWGGSLWKENTILGRKPVSAGWKAKKNVSWHISHELLELSLTGHIWDAFRLVTGQEFTEWIQMATPEEFVEISCQVFDSFFTVKAINSLRDGEVHDIMHENTLLFNRDALWYFEFCDGVRSGDIGRVLNILQVWMLMMRGENRMPRYSDLIFETLNVLDGYPEELRELYLCNWLVNLSGKPNRWKEVDLLQEHQNFWAKVIISGFVNCIDHSADYISSQMIYSAKGSNRSWEWLSMITVCIFVLRDAMRKVGTVFEIPVLGSKHTDPSMYEDVQIIARYMQEERLHEMRLARLGNSEVEPIVDLLQAGVAAMNKPKVLKKFFVDSRRAVFCKGADNGSDNDIASDEDNIEDSINDNQMEEFDIDIEGLTEWDEGIYKAALEIMESMDL